MRQGYAWLTPIVVAVSAAVLSGCAGNQSSVATTIPSDAQTVHVTATDFKWTMDKTTFHSGHPIDFVVQSNTGVHGFSIVQTHESHTLAAGDKPVQLLWTPPGPGQYTIKCNVYCGGGHDNMFTSFTVQ